MSEKKSPQQHWVGSKTNSKKVVTLVSIIIGVALILAGSAFFVTQSYAQTFAPGVHIGSLNVGGTTRAQAEVQLQEFGKKLREQGVTVSYKDKDVVITTQLDALTDPDLARELISFDWQETLDIAFSIGHGGNFFTNSFELFSSAVTSPEVTPVIMLDEQEIISILKASFADYETPAKNAELIVVNGEVEVSQEQEGITLEYAAAVQELGQRLAALSLQSIQLREVVDEPQIKKQFTGSALNSIESILQNEQITLTYEDDTWYIEQETYIPWLELQLNEGQVIVGVSKDEVIAYLEDIAQQINEEPVKGEFKLENGKVVEFSLSQDGLTLNTEESYQKINQQIFTGDRSDIELVVAVEPASDTSATVNDLGIVKLLGQGWSDFAGSPANRKHNIGVGAGSVDGTLIPPGEEFSLLDALGEIDGTSGYRQELVIKGDRTIPEYGGGLCQVATTAFRAALKSGLPITQRRNHSYRVSYYEPPVGMDATIYDPAPDFRFLNDTQHHLLWVTRVIGTELVFEIYGTPDGRVASTTEPIVYNHTDPGEPRYVETDELEPGVKKKVESAHWGADAIFTYTVTYPDGTVKEEDFKSHYVPWKETWLIGKEATTTEEGVEDEDDGVTTIDELPEDFDIEDLLQ